MAKPRKPCAGCGGGTTKRHPILGCPCCTTCQAVHPQYRTILECTIADTIPELSKLDLICLRHRRQPDLEQLDRDGKLDMPQDMEQLDRDDTPKAKALAKGMEPWNIYLSRHVKELAASRQVRRNA
jgi:hypothetical protein